MAAPGGEFRVGQQVAALMGGMGRTLDGGYAEYTCVPASQIVPFTSDLDWAILGAIPEMLQTAHGSLTAYGGGAEDLPAVVLQSFLDRVAAGDLTVPGGHVYSLDQIVEAHADMEANRATGKRVVLP